MVDSTSEKVCIPAKVSETQIKLFCRAKQQNEGKQQYRSSGTAQWDSLHFNTHFIKFTRYGLSTLNFFRLITKQKKCKFTGNLPVGKFTWTWLRSGVVQKVKTSPFPLRGLSFRLPVTFNLISLQDTNDDRNKPYVTPPYRRRALLTCSTSASTLLSKTRCIEANNPTAQFELSLPQG